MGAGLQLVLSVDHDLLVGLEAGIRPAPGPSLICATLTGRIATVLSALITYA